VKVGEELVQLKESRLQQSWERLAPASVNLLGGHTDYTGGLVLPMAIPFYTRATVHRIEGAISCLHTELFDEDYRLSSI
jgi:galactokinase